MPGHQPAEPPVAELAPGNDVPDVFAELEVAGRSEAIVRARDAGLGR